MLRVMSYNVRYFGHASRGVLSTRGGIDRIATTVAKMPALPDLICLQEVETRSLRASRSLDRSGSGRETQLAALLRALDGALAALGKAERYEAYYFAAHQYRVTDTLSIYTTGLAVLAKSGLSVLGHNAARPHDITHRPRLVRLKQTRICAHVAFQGPQGGRVEVFNTHLSLPSFWSREFWTAQYRMGFGKNQLIEARELVRFIEKERQTDCFIVAGDFNSLPGSPVDCFLRQEVGLRDAFREARGDADDSARAFPTAGFLNMKMHLDHLYASPGIAWLDLEGTSAFGETGDFDGLSDHVPLIARFDLKDRLEAGRPA